jgi:hypothetical protein
MTILQSIIGIMFITRTGGYSLIQKGVRVNPPVQDVGWHLRIKAKFVTISRRRPGGRRDFWISSTSCLTNAAFSIFWRDL